MERYRPDEKEEEPVWEEEDSFPDRVVRIDASDTGETEFMAEMEAAFSATGWMSRSRDFEYRPEQQMMAKEVARALALQKPVVIEAGTGVGKSLAYLIPSVLHAQRHKRKAVVSTHTINLQEQLMSKDIPLVRKVIPEGMRDFKAVLLKGRSNYLCSKRLARALGQQGELFTTLEREELQRIAAWAKTSADGTLSDLDFTPSPAIWVQVCSEQGVCTARSCGPDSGCFYQSAKRRVAEADLVVVNHTLFFTLLSGTENFGAEGQGFLFPNDFLIMDEAHTLENIAAKQLGLNLSQAGLRFDLQRLFHPRTKKGLFALTKSLEGMKETEQTFEAMEEFFYDVQHACKFSPAGKEFRVRAPGLVEDALSDHLMRLIQRLRILSEDKTLNEGLQPELQELSRRFAETRLELDEFLSLRGMDRVYWVERSGPDGRNTSLHGAPVNVAEILREVFFNGTKSCVLTSATFGAGEPELKYFRRRVGAERVRGVELGSPFDYPQQMKLYLVKTMPEPTHPDYESAMETHIQRFCEESKGRAFVLFTSYRLMESMAGRMAKFFARKRWELLVQGKGKPRHQLLAEFKEDVSSVLFGTESFWTGVDVPGEALSNVMITRLPFAVPDHPLTAARLEYIEDHGGNPFMEYSVPEAILKLRQGIGRLIRSKKDHGIAVILDNRVLTKQYGKQFLKAMPDAPRIIV
jgi:ATP-dependent DNA helicase DinG